MPGKLRAPKTRYDAKAEFDAWEMTFESGCDFFRETGCVLPLDVWPPEDRPPFERAFRAAAHAAWLPSRAVLTEARRRCSEPRHTVGASGIWRAAMR